MGGAHSLSGAQAVSCERKALRPCDAAKGEALEFIELIGILIAIGLVTWVTGKISAGVSAGGGFIVGMLSFILAIPLLARSAGPFMVRRMRRGLRKRLNAH